MPAQLGEVSTSLLLDGARLFRLSGEFDMSNVWKIRDALVPALREDRDVVVDLSEVEFFDGRLVRLLVQARVAAFRRGQAFRIVPPRERHALWRVAEAGELRLAA